MDFTQYFFGMCNLQWCVWETQDEAAMQLPFPAPLCRLLVIILVKSAIGNVSVSTVLHFSFTIQQVAISIMLRIVNNYQE